MTFDAKLTALTAQWGRARALGAVVRAAPAPSLRREAAGPAQCWDQRLQTVQAQVSRCDRERGVLVAAGEAVTPESWQLWGEEIAKTSAAVALLEAELRVALERQEVAMSSRWLALGEKIDLWGGGSLGAAKRARQAYALCGAFAEVALSVAHDNAWENYLAWLRQLRLVGAAGPHPARRAQWQTLVAQRDALVMQRWALLGPLVGYLNMAGAVDGALNGGSDTSGLGRHDLAAAVAAAGSVAPFAPLDLVGFKSKLDAALPKLRTYRAEVAAFNRAADRFAAQLAGVQQAYAELAEDLAALQVDPLWQDAAAALAQGAKLAQSQGQVTALREALAADPRQQELRLPPGAELRPMERRWDEVAASFRCLEAQSQVLAQRSGLLLSLGWSAGESFLAKKRAENKQNPAQEGRAADLAALALASRIVVRLQGALPQSVAQLQQVADPAARAAAQLKHESLQVLAPRVERLREGLAASVADTPGGAAVDDDAAPDSEGEAALRSELHALLEQIQTALAVNESASAGCPDLGETLDLVRRAERLLEQLPGPFWHSERQRFCTSLDLSLERVDALAHLPSLFVGAVNLERMGLGAGVLLPGDAAHPGLVRDYFDDPDHDFAATWAAAGLLAQAKWLRRERTFFTGLAATGRHRVGAAAMTAAVLPAAQRAEYEARWQLFTERAGLFAAAVLQLHRRFGPAWTVVQWFQAAAVRAPRLPDELLAAVSEPAYLAALNHPEPAACSVASPATGDVRDEGSRAHLCPGCMARRQAVQRCEDAAQGLRGVVLAEGATSPGRAAAAAMAGLCNEARFRDVVRAAFAALMAPAGRGVDRAVLTTEALQRLSGVLMRVSDAARSQAKGRRGSAPALHTYLNDAAKGAEMTGAAAEGRALRTHAAAVARKGWVLAPGECVLLSAMVASMATVREARQRRRTMAGYLALHRSRRTIFGPPKPVRDGAGAALETTGTGATGMIATPLGTSAAGMPLAADLSWGERLHHLPDDAGVRLARNTLLGEGEPLSAQAVWDVCFWLRFKLGATGPYGLDGVVAAEMKRAVGQMQQERAGRAGALKRGLQGRKGPVRGKAAS